MPRELIEGGEELHRKLIALGSLEGGKVLRAAAHAAGVPIMREARARIPTNDRSYLKKTYKGRKVAPGFAKRSIAKRVKLSADKSSATVSVGVRREAFYAVNFVELGTSKQGSQPWLRPAARLTRREQIARLGDTIRRKIVAVARGGR